MFRCHSLIAAVAGCLAWSGIVAADTVSERFPLGRKVEDFRLNDCYGATHSLAHSPDKKVIVLAFLGTQCPLARLYGPRLAQLERTYKPLGVRFLGIDSNRQDTPSRIAAFARSCGIAFPILKDLNNKVADQIGAVRTPEIFVLDREHAVRYHGRVDNQYGVGYARRDASEAFLPSALDELLQGRAVTRPETEVAGCFIGRARTPDASAKVTYCKQVARILANRCVSCHRIGEIGPFALTTLAEASGWADAIAEAVDTRRMPPWLADPSYGHFSNDRRLPDEEKRLLNEWAAAGAPEGDRGQLPPLPKMVDGWQLPKEPDQVIYITEQPVAVPAQGTVKYQYFTVDPQFKEDKWIKAIEVRPGDRSVVHHVMVVAHPKRAGKGGRRRVRGDQNLISFVPGGMPMVLPPGMAKFFPHDYEFLFEVHYTPNGSPQTDRSKMGLIFADRKEVTHRVQWLPTSDLDFVIPPGNPDYVVEADSPPVGGAHVQLLQLYPHAHLRCKSFRYEARYRDGKSEILLDVPRYDFGWQLTYRLATPKPLPSGTIVHATVHYDNSDSNPNNPDPKATVREGDQTWEEMLVGNFEIVSPVSPDELSRSYAAATARRRMWDVNRGSYNAKSRPELAKNSSKDQGDGISQLARLSLASPDPKVTDRPATFPRSSTHLTLSFVLSGLLGGGLAWFCAHFVRNKSRRRG